MYAFDLLYTFISIINICTLPSHYPQVSQFSYLSLLQKPSITQNQMGGNSPCASCKLLRRRCAKDCIFAPYFPSDDPHKFAIVHKVFGASNVSKMLQVSLPFSLSFLSFLRIQIIYIIHTICMCVRARVFEDFFWLILSSRSYRFIRGQMQ